MSDPMPEPEPLDEDAPSDPDNDGTAFPTDEPTEG